MHNVKKCAFISGSVAAIAAIPAAYFLSSSGLATFAELGLDSTSAIVAYSASVLLSVLSIAGIGAGVSYGVNYKQIQDNKKLAKTTKDGYEAHDEEYSDKDNSMF